MFKNMKIGRKLITAFVAVSIISSIAGLVGIILIRRLDSGYSAALVNNGFSQGDIGSFNTYLNKGGAVVRDLIFLKDKNDLANSQAEFETVKTQTLDSLAKLKLTCTMPDEVALIKTIDEELALYQTSRDQVVALGLAGKNDEALALFRSTARPNLNACMAAADKLKELNTTMGSKASVSLSAQAQLAMLAIVLVVAGSLAVSLILALYISRSISKPVSACAERLVALSKGDLHSEIAKSDSKDETGIMLRALKTTVEALNDAISDVAFHLGEIAGGNLSNNVSKNYEGDLNPLEVSMKKILVSLNDAMGQINQTSDQVASGSDQVSSGAQALSQGATEQASSVEELAATITEISGQVRSNAQNAAEASSKTSFVSSQMQESNQQMQEMIAAMSQISKSSQEIGKVIKTIEDIAFQTNILALNAAVEAARAGAAGKGFAVVADEVRNLASKSAEAAKGTTALIEDSIKAVENGTRIADNTAKSLLSVVSGAQEVTVSVDRISAASNEQANSIAQVTMGVDQISAVVQTNSATAEESAAASEELSSQAQVLKSLVGRFKLKNGGGSMERLEPSARDTLHYTVEDSHFGDKY